MEFSQVAIFGATGVTGINIAAECLRRDLRVRVVSRNPEKLEAAFGAGHVQIYPADLRDREAAVRACDDCQLIFHCVGLPVENFSDHVPVTQNTLAAMRAQGARGVLIGSFWSYGPVLDNPVTEEHDRNPVSRKGRLRKHQEEIFLEGGGAVVDLPDFYGPQSGVGLLNPALEAIAHNHIANWIGRLDADREFIYVPDAAFPILELAGREEAYGQRWNLAGSGAVTPRQLLRMAADMCGIKHLRVRTANRFILAMLGLVSRQIREMREMYPLYMNPPILDCGKLRKLIGDYPVTPYEEGVRRTLEWIVELNPSAG